MLPTTVLFKNPLYDCEKHTTKDYAQAIFPIFSSYLAALSAKNNGVIQNAISSLYQAIIGDMSNLTLYDGASGLGNTSLRFSPAKLIMREAVYASITKYVVV